MPTVSPEQIIEAIPAALKFANDYGPLPGANAGDGEAQVEIARRFVAAAEAAGMRMVGPDQAVVPREPTRAMLWAMRNSPGHMSTTELMRTEWAAALAAAEAGDG
ncbi:MAG: hypothetical protein AAFR79_12650 [Pseudomonadota bacterium]